jgi:membrane-associated phospholipid phosphatase
LYPAATPWYVALHGFEENFNIPGNEAGLANFDKLFGIDLFHSMYARNANVFAAIPSMHSAFPALSLYYAIKKKSNFWIGLFIIVGIGIWFSAVYSIHHYIIDVLLGILCAVLAILLFEILRKNDKIQNLLHKYEAIVS